MEVGRINEDSNITTTANTVLLPHKRLHSEVLHSLWMPNSSPSFHGPASLVNFKDGHGEITKERPFFPQIDKEETSNDDYDSSCFHQPEKKRRLLPNQVSFLEKSFEVDNKLEPERKVQLAKELGLQPRQVAIWFQNRRARYKNKQLEKDYDVLKASFDKLKDDYDTLFKENGNLRNEVHLLREKMQRREKGKESSEQSTDPIQLVDAEDEKKATPIVVTSDAPISTIVCKQEDATSAKSDVIDSDSPHYTDDGNHHSLYLEPADSSNVFEVEPEPSDFSQDEDDNNLSKNFLCFPEIDVIQIQANSCNLDFQIEDQQPSWFWQY